MKLWPFVTRARHETLRRDWGELHARALNAEVQARQHELQATELRAIARAAEKHAEALLNEVEYLRGQLAEKDRSILEMRREGFDPPPASAPTAALKDDRPKLDPAIRLAIEGFADPGTADYLLLEEQARRGLAEKMSVEQVVEDIREGSRFNPHHL